ncbi:MAG: CopG family antitoxin [Terracidiphilus sp.]
MKRKNVANELVEAMREAAAIAQGEALPSATHNIPLPSEAEERAFWESPKNDSTEYIDWTKAKLVTFSKLRPSTNLLQTRRRLPCEE